MEATGCWHCHCPPPPSRAQHSGNTTGECGTVGICHTKPRARRNSAWIRSAWCLRNREDEAHSSHTHLLESSLPSTDEVPPGQPGQEVSPYGWEKASDLPTSPSHNSRDSSIRHPAGTLANTTKRGQRLTEQRKPGNPRAPPERQALISAF